MDEKLKPSQEHTASNLAKSLKRALRFGTALTLAAALRAPFMSTPIAFADGGPNGDSAPTASTIDSSTIPVQVDSQGRLIPAQLYYPRLVLNDDSIWGISESEVKAAEADTGYTLSPDQELEAVNAIKNLTEAASQNTDNKFFNPNLLIPHREVIAYPVRGAISIMVESLALNPNSLPESGLVRTLHRMIDYVANPGVDYTNDPAYRIELKETQDLLSTMLTLNPATAQGGVIAQMECNPDGTPSMTWLQNYTLSKGGEWIWNVIEDLNTHAQYVVAGYKPTDIPIENPRLMNSQMGFPGTTLTDIRGKGQINLQPNTRYKIFSFRGNSSDQNIQIVNTPIATTTLLTCPNR